MLHRLIFKNKQTTIRKIKILFSRFIFLPIEISCNYIIILENLKKYLFLIRLP